jgi:NAD(P)-dependent dehydrogenase (short-subunit alcohol dehydrogenase family)
MSSDLGTPAKRHKDIYDFISPQKLAGSLSGKVALITGAGRGIGKAMALAFAEAGCDIALLARTQIQLESVADEICTKFGRHALVLAADVTDERAVSEAVGRAETELGGLDVVIANAGVGQVRPFAMTPVEEWWRVMEVNVKGQMITAHAALGSMRARGKGTVIFIVSSAAAVDFGKLYLLQCLVHSLSGTLPVESWNVRIWFV